MPQPRDGRRFSLEARERRGRRRSARGEDLQRDLTAEGDLGSAIDATHPAGAELRIDSITAGDDGARGERGRQPDLAVPGRRGRYLVEHLLDRKAKRFVARALGRDELTTPLGLDVEGCDENLLDACVSVAIHESPRTIAIVARRDRTGKRDALARQHLRPPRRR